MDKLFVIAIGGTGMRCLESFVHLCAVGMFDSRTIEVMMLDTDSTNGNLDRTERLIELYNNIKTDGDTPTPDQKGGSPNSNTFFSAKLNFYKFCTNYSDTDRNTYNVLSHLSEGDETTKRQNRLLSDLFFEKNTVQEFKLDHGYRAQTHLGSYLMYHAIVESARKLKSEKDESDKSLDNFLEKLRDAGEAARVFVFGSVFGGTGASSIPIIPVAFREAIKVSSKGQSDLDLKKTKFGSTLLTQYFTFKSPDAAQKKSEKVVADASFFAINSQAAMQFYQKDPTVQNTYKRMYHIGWPIEATSTSKNERETITGGGEQKNNCHICELLCACAAYDFFTLSDDDLKGESVQCLYRRAEFLNEAFNISAADLVGQADSDKFLSRIGAFYSLAHIVLTYNEAAKGKQADNGTKAILNRLKSSNVNLYDTISDNALEQMDEFFRMFGYSVSEGKFNPGWIYQVRNSLKQGSFLFKNEAFPTQATDLNPKRMNVGDFYNDGAHKWSYEDFTKKLTDDEIVSKGEDHQNVSTPQEKFIARIYNAIFAVQNY
ncbi:MAG: hypothetical protein K6D59_07890 [Bacteroidales bacterium]|nr:hypothetical protein [Bacteroidales bacterium]